MWTFTIGETKPRPDNPLNLQTTVTWVNTDTGETFQTFPFAHDIQQTIRAHCRSILNDVLPFRDAALADMKTMEGATLDLAPTADEQAKTDMAAKQVALQKALAAKQLSTLAADSNPDVAKAAAALIVG